jgi:hypothetical protein
MKTGGNDSTGAAHLTLMRLGRLRFSRRNSFSKHFINRRRNLVRIGFGDCFFQGKDSSGHIGNGSDRMDKIPPTGAFVEAGPVGVALKNRWGIVDKHVNPPAW